MLNELPVTHESTTEQTCGATTLRALRALLATDIPGVGRHVSLPRGAPLFDSRFSLRREIGRGSMGVVYEAVDTQRDQRVALKMCTHSDGASLYELKQEFRSAAQLRHPNLVRFYGLYGDAQAWFLTMELLRGDSLLCHLAGHPGWGHLRHVFSQIVSGITAIHAAGKLHRDLKPQNLMVTPEGRAVILDFGLVADASAGGVGQTLPRISGTPAYMAPEQAAGKPTTEASDW